MTEESAKSLSPIAIDPDELIIHKLYRERVTQEDNLINHRMTWFFASQSFLVLSWAALYKTSGNISKASLIIDGVAVWFSYHSQKSIKAAHAEIYWLDTKYRSIYKIYDDGYSPIALNPNGAISERNAYIPTLLGGDNRHREGHIVTKYSPFAVYGIWGSAVLAFFDQKFHYIAAIVRKLNSI